MRTPILFLSLYFTFHLTAQNFTWIRGSNTISPAGVYGIKGVSSSTTDPGGRHGAATWVDKQGKFWLLGGEGYGNSNASSCWLNDLWKYDPSIDEWAWMHGDSLCNSQGDYVSLGIPSFTASPGGREFAQFWTDTAGMLWLFGGAGYSNNSTFGIMNDLWRYNPTSNQWTWMGGSNSSNQLGNYGTQGVPASTNFPGARQAAGTWTGNDGHLYLFGGRGYAATGSPQFLNDLWRYNISTNQWTWIKGTNMIGQTGVFGTVGTPAPGNMPGGKEFPATWKDAAGALYLFGGRGAGYFNDLWKFDIATNNWTWVHGANIANQKGMYGTLGIPSNTTVPGGRLNNHSWVDPAGDFWLFGGQGWSATTLNLLNDLWRYDPCSNEWTWMKGSDTTNRYGNYGTAGQTATTNIAGSRMYINAWTDQNKKPWFMGGEGFDAGSISIGHMNDVWNLEVPKRSDTLYSSATKICSGKTVTLSVNTAYNGVLWYAANNLQQVIGTGTVFVTPTLSAVNPTTVSYYALINCPAKPKSLITVSVQPLPTISLISSQPTLCTGSSAILTASGGVTYSVNGISTPASFTISPTTTTAYSVTGADSFGCENSASLSLVVNICVGALKQSLEPIAVTLFPNPARDKITIVLTERLKDGVFSLYDLQGKMILNKQISTNDNTISLELPEGLYIYYISTTKAFQYGKLIVE